MKTKKEIEPCIHGDLGDCLDCNHPPAPSHTPTPWNVATSIKEFVPKEQGGGLKVRLMSGNVRIGTLNSKEDPELARANATFIASVVNSHKYVLDVLHEVRFHLEHQDQDRATSGLLEHVLKAIAKAEGK